MAAQDRYLRLIPLAGTAPFWKGTAEPVIQSLHVSACSEERSRDGAQTRAMKRPPRLRRPTPVPRAAGRPPTPAPSGAGTGPVPPPTSLADHRAARAMNAVQAAQAAVDADQAVARGVSLHQGGQLAQAEAHYRRAMALSPAHPEALHLLGL